MPRATNNPASRARRKKIMLAARGYFGARSKVYTVAKNTLEKGWQYAFRDRKFKKRTFRRLWIARINAATRAGNSRTLITRCVSPPRRGCFIR